MPYENERSSGDSLIWLENSQALKEFEGTILVKEGDTPVEPPTLQVTRRNWYPRRVIAIDGSNLIHRVNSGFPGAEAGLLMTSVVAIKLDQIKNQTNKNEKQRTKKVHVTVVCCCIHSEA